MTCDESLSADLKLAEEVFRMITRTIDKREVFHRLIMKADRTNNSEKKVFHSQMNRIDLKSHNINNINEAKTTNKSKRIDRLACNADCKADRVLMMLLQ